jgi:hypothetical protein
MGSYLYYFSGSLANLDVHSNKKEASLATIVHNTL